MTSATEPVQARFQREEVAAAARVAGSGAGSGVDQRGLAVATETTARLVEELEGAIEGWRVWRDEVTVTVPVGRLLDVLTWLRDEAGWALLSDVSPCDWLGADTPHPKRFAVSYHVTKLAPGAPRLRVQVWVDEDEEIPSAIRVYPTADWHEREAWDFFGITFSGREEMRRLLMAEDWVGHPLRKDYPMGGEPVKFTNSLRET